MLLDVVSEQSASGVVAAGLAEQNQNQGYPVGTPAESKKEGKRQKSLK